MTPQSLTMPEEMYILLLSFLQRGRYDQRSHSSSLRRFAWGDAAESDTDRLNLSAGDKVFAVETEHGILLTPYDPDFLRVMEAEARISKHYHNALRELAQ